MPYFYLQNALEMVRKSKIFLGSLPLAQVHINASATPTLAVHLLPDHLKFLGYGPATTSYYCAHEQKAHGLQLIGVATKITVFVTLVDLAQRIVKAVFRWLLQVCCIVKSLRCLDLAIWQFS